MAMKSYSLKESYSLYASPTMMERSNRKKRLANSVVVTRMASLLTQSTLGTERCWMWMIIDDPGLKSISLAH